MEEERGEKKGTEGGRKGGQARTADPDKSYQNHKGERRMMGKEVIIDPAGRRKEVRRERRRDMIKQEAPQLQLFKVHIANVSSASY